MTFSSFNFSPELLSGIEKCEFTTPTPVQAEVIPFILENKTDLIALAQTGTGKTGAFGLPILEKINPTDLSTQALVLCPTRELCVQIARDLKSFAADMPNIKIAAIYGGTDIKPQLQAFDDGIQIVIATPGRLLDLIDGGKTDFSSVQRIVLDEADEMLNMGFEEDLNGILSEVPSNSQVLLFSATMPRTVARIAESYMRSPHEITIGSRNSATDQVTHQAMLIHTKDRYNSLRRLVDATPDIYGIIFCRTRVETKMVTDKLTKNGYSAGALHGDMYQDERDMVMNAFRDHRLQLLVATDVAARGIDVNDLTHVIHYAMPDDFNTYTHRSGRTGRAGKTGISILIYHQRELHKVERIAKGLKKQFEQRAIPTGDDIASIRLNHVVDQINAIEVNDELIGRHFDEMATRLADLSKDELIKRIALLQQQSTLQYYNETPDLSTEPEKQRTKPTPKNKVSGKEAREAHVAREMTEGMIELVINVGKRNELTKESLKELINSTTEQPLAIGRINIVEMQSYFEVPYADSMNLIEQFKKSPAEFAGRAVNVALAGNARPAGTSAKTQKRTSRYDRQRNDDRNDSRSNKPFNKNKKRDGQFNRKKQN